MGYKREQFVNNVDENLICAICHEVLQDPHGCKEGHSFCKDCITEWLKTKQTCPMDNDSVLQVNNLMRNLIAYNMVQSLKIWCHPSEKDEGAEGVDLKTKDSEKSHLRGQRPNNKSVPVLEKKCEWQGKLQSLAKHRETCLFQQVPCPNEHCTKTMQRRELEDHNTKCEYRKLECKKCRKILAQNDFQKHTEDECPETLVPCPNKCKRLVQRQGQIRQIKRIDLDNHIKNNCPKAMVSCLFKDQGCSVRVERQHVDKHVQDNMTAHMMLLAKQCSLVTKQNSSLTEQCSALNQKCLSLTEENRLLQDELTQVKGSLAELASSAKCSYVWTINDFPALAKVYPNGSAFSSPIFWLSGHKLNFMVYPNGIDEETEGWLSLFLALSEEFPEKPGRGIFKIPDNERTVKYRLSVISIRPDTDDVYREVTHVFKKTESWGWPKFMKTSVALSSAYCNSTDGSLIIHCIIQ